MSIQNISELFKQKFNNSPVIVRSPGRVNLIGEHTDYNDGFVLPAAIDKQIIFALSPNDKNIAQLYSADMDQAYAFDISKDGYDKSDLGWPNYLIGVVQQLTQVGYEVGGFDCVFGGDIPIGAGMSSSAALEGGLLTGLNHLFQLDLRPEEIAKIGQQAENEFVGVRCGIMDQFANIFGRDGRVFKLDCRSLEIEYYPFERDDLRIVLCDTQVRRALAASEYNIRRNQCEQGVELLQKFIPDVLSLRNVTPAMLQEHASAFDPVIYKRCEYVVEENQRVEKACHLLQVGDYKGFGLMMNDSHDGLSNKYEVSSPELDFLAGIAMDFDGVLGSRMMGAGFGGCTINLVEASAIDDFTEMILRRYRDQFDMEASVYISRITGGTEILD